MKSLLAACIVAFAAMAAHAEPIAAAPSALGGWIILKTEHCEAPLSQWHQYAITRADGLVVTSGCYYLTQDQQRVVAREGSTLTPIVWPAEAFHVIPKTMRGTL